MFGIQWFDIAMHDSIRVHGFTVEEAAILKRDGRLPTTLARDWAKYEEHLAAYRKQVKENEGLWPQTKS